MTDGITVVLHDPAAPHPPPEWMDVTGAPPAWRWPVLRALALDRRGAVLAATLHDGPRRLGLVAGRIHGLHGRSRRPMLGIVELDCPGTSALPGILIPGADVAAHAAAAAALEHAVTREYGRRIRAIAYRQVSAEILPMVLRRTSLVHEGSPVAVLENRFDDYAGYLKTLRTSRRRDQVRLLRRFSEDGSLSIRLGSSAAAAASMAGRLDDLVRVTQRRHRGRWAWPPTPRVAVGVLAALLADSCVSTLTYSDGSGELLGCMVLQDHPKTPVLGSWGARSPRGGGRSGMWFDMMARAVRWCVESHRPELVGGKALPELKAELGFTLHRQWAVVQRLPRS